MLLFDDIITNRDTYSAGILLDKKIYENISVYDIPNKTSTCSKPLRISFDKIDRFIRDRGCEFRRLLLFDYGLLDKICESEKSGFADSINHNFGEIRIVSYNSLPMEKNIDFS